MATSGQWSDVPAVNQAVQYLLQQYQAWQLLPPRLRTTRAQAAVVEQAADGAGNAGVSAAMAAVRSSVDDLEQRFLDTAPSFAAVVQALNTPGRPLDFDTVGTALDLAATVGTSLAAQGQNEAEVARDAPKVLSGPALQALGTLGNPAGGTAERWLFWTGLGAVTYWLLKWRR